MVARLIRGDRREEFANKFSTVLGFFLRINRYVSKFADKHIMDEDLGGQEGESVRLGKQWIIHRAQLSSG